MTSAAEQHSQSNSREGTTLATDPYSVVPTPRHIEIEDGLCTIPEKLTVQGAVEAVAALRPLFRVLEDCGAISSIEVQEPHQANSAAFLRVDEGFDSDNEVGSLGNEAYELTVTTAGISLTGTKSGILHGTQTLISLLPTACLMPGSMAHAVLQNCHILDSPTFAWRGMMIDSARHFMPIAWLRQVVRIAAFHKLNVLHLHLTDDQGWRVPIDAYPRLIEVSARRRETVGMPYPTDERDGIPHGGFYTKEELRSLVRYADQFGITVVPEVNLPGHMVAGIAAYPEWGNSEQPVEVRTTWGISEDIINTRPETIEALKTILDEVMEVFPSPYIHLGGDEVPTRDWENSTEVADLMEREGLASPRAVQGWIMNSLVEHVQAKGRTVLGWDETVDAGIDSEVIIQAWRTPQRVSDALAAGYKTIASPQQHYYLDYRYADDPAEPPSIGMTRNAYISMEDVLAYQVPATVLGVEAPLWSEFVKDPQRAAYQLLPRLAGVAEKAWRGNEVSRTRFDVALVQQDRRYEALGWEHRPLDGPGVRWSRVWDEDGA